MTVRLLIACPDTTGIVAAVAGFLADRGANVVSSDQHTTDPWAGRFLMRLEFVPAAGGPGLARVREEFGREVGERFAMEWRMTPSEPPSRVAILASREDHCLLDLLWRSRRGALPGQVVTVVSNHADLAEDAASFGVPFHHVSSHDKRESEERVLELLAGADSELVVLARYMQILSAGFLERVGAPVINIHHSFLPAFVGADPYRRALERGVKLIGATAHYATEDLDAGPIIAQDVEPVDHRDTLATLTERGRDIERRVLARAVRAHLEDRVLVADGRTVVF